MRAFAYAGLLILLGLPIRAGAVPSAVPSPLGPPEGTAPSPLGPPEGTAPSPLGPPEGRAVLSPVGGEQSPNRERWDKLSAEERERLREVYRRLQKLPPAERDRLLEKLRTMTAKDRRQTIERARERLHREGTPEPGGELGPGPPAFRLPPEARRRLERLPPEERRREAQKLYQEAFRRWVKGLPPDLRERVKRFTPREQREFLRAYRESGLLFRTFPGEGEEEALLNLSPERLRSLMKAGSERPEGISRSSWDRWRKLPPRGRNQIIRRLEILREERSAFEPVTPGGSKGENATVPSGDLPWGTEGAGSARGESTAADQK